MARADVVLVSMPWTTPTEPSLGLGILKRCLTQGGIRAKTLHTAPKLLRWISLETYQFLASCWGVDEFLFTSVIDPLCDDRQLECLVERAEEYVAVQGHPRYPTVQTLCDMFFKVRDEIMPPYLRMCAERILEYSPALVGFTCMFDQTIASVALAKLLKEQNPRLFVALGGYALEGPPGNTVEHTFPWIDVVVRGDGEEIVVDLARSALAHFGAVADDITLKKPMDEGPALKILAEKQENPSSASRNSSGVLTDRLLRGKNVDLSRSPNPDYADWFEDINELAKADNIAIRTRVLPVESSRGCWWGQQKHCVFCGIDDDALKYRHKPATVALEMLRELRALYGDHVFRFADYIMPKNYYTELLPLLAREEPKFRLEAEIKANHPPDRVRLLADAGFLELQPGIESFSTPVLMAMDKGVRAIDNVSLLKAGYINKIVINYNLLYGLPSDTIENYLKMAEGIPRIYHLTPPIARTETVVTRFAPMQIHPERFGFKTSVTHHRCYDMLFSGSFVEQTAFSLDDYAYYFDRYFEYAPELETLYSQVVFQIDYWKATHRSRFIELSYSRTEEGLQITDSRFGEQQSYELSGLEASIYMACNDAPVHIEQIKSRLPVNGSTCSEQVSQCISRLDDLRIVWREKDLIFGLAVPKTVCDDYRKCSWPRSWMSLYVS